MKLLLYCTKAKPTLYNVLGKYIITEYMGKDFMQNGIKDPKLNGKIVAECDFEVEKITYELYGDLDWQHDYLPTTNTLSICSLEDESCLTRDEMDSYLKGKNGYAIHIKNLHIFDEPKELSNYKGDSKGIFLKVIEKAPQNMQMVLNEKLEDCILISIKPQWLYKILNGEKTIEVRKKVLKEMLK